MDNNLNTDDDRQTSSSDQSSSDGLSSVSSETLLPVHENDQPQVSNMSSVHVCRVKVDSRNNLPNLKIKHPNQPDDGRNNSFNDGKRIILDKHIKVSRVNHSDLRNLTKDISPLKLQTRSNEKTQDSVTVSHVNQSPFENINGNLNKRDTTKTTSRKETVRINRTSTAVNINQDPKKKIATSRPMVTRVPFDQLPLKKKRIELYVSIQRVTVNSKKSS